MQTFRAEALQKFFRAEKITPFRAEGGLGVVFVRGRIDASTARFTWWSVRRQPSMKDVMVGCGQAASES